MVFIVFIRSIKLIFFNRIGIFGYTTTFCSFDYPHGSFVYTPKLNLKNNGYKNKNNNAHKNNYFI